MARRVVSEDELGPAVPRWVVEFDPARFPEGSDWVNAVWDWADTNLSPAHRAAAYDLKERSFKAWVGGDLGA